MRYFKATLFLGTLSAVLVVILYATGWISTTPDQSLRKAYALAAAPAAPGWLQVFLILLLSYAVVWTTIDIPKSLFRGFIALAAAFLLFTGSLVLALYQVFWSPLPAIVAVLFAYIAGLFYGRSSGGTHKARVENLFGRRVSRGVMRQLLNSDKEAPLAGAVREGTVVVCEIQNHKELMEYLEPEDYAAMTNLFHQTATDFLVESGGYLEECTGESLRVVFGMPLAEEGHAAKACRVALDLAHRLDILNKECDSQWQRRFDFRIGINSGDIFGAALGGSRLPAFSVAGPAVELARRLCAACATYGCRILVGPDTFQQASETFEARPVEVLKFAGERRRVELYEILAPKHGLSPERERSRDHFWRGVLYYRDQQWDKAVEEFSQARISGIPDAVLDLYLSRVERARRNQPEPQDVNRQTLLQSL